MPPDVVRQAVVQYVKFESFLGSLFRFFLEQEVRFSLKLRFDLQESVAVPNLPAKVIKCHEGGHWGGGGVPY